MKKRLGVRAVSSFPIGSLTLTLLAACVPGPVSPLEARAPSPLAALTEGAGARVEVRELALKPRLTLVTREGDPAPAVAVAFVTEAGSAITAALAGVVEARVRAAGFDVDVRVDRDAFFVRAALPDPARLLVFLGAMQAAAARPIGPAEDLGVSRLRLQTLRRNPLEAPELAAVAACTGAIGVTASEPMPDVGTEAGLGAIEAARRSLGLGRVAIAAVGAGAFVGAVANALERTDPWPTPVPASRAPWPAGDGASVYVAASLARASAARARVTVAVRVADPVAAAGAAERVGAADSALVERLHALPDPWRVVDASGVARPHGGCVALSLEPADRAPRSPGAAALVAAIARREIEAELRAATPPSAIAHQILTAADPRESASRAAWWSLVAAEPGAPMRWTSALGVAPASDRPVRDDGAADPAASGRFDAELEAVVTAPASGAERRVAVERGQGELWLLLASPCGVAEEGVADAGMGALAVLAAIEERRRTDGVTVEPWITADGTGVLAHARVRDDRETPADLARRVADAAARALTATTPSREAFASARLGALGLLERTQGAEGVAMTAFASAAAPDHPSWVDPFGSWRKVAAATPEATRLRAQAIARGPMRAAVIANADAAQATAALEAVDRWLSPVAAPRTCRASAASPPHVGHVDVRLPDSALLSQAIVGVPLPGPAWRDLAELTALALDGQSGLGPAVPDAAVSARVEGGARAPMLVVDVRASADALAAATVEAKAALLKLAAGATDADFERARAAWERRERQAHLDPRARVADLWLGRAPSPPPTLAAWRAFLAPTVREAALLVVEARPR